MQTFKGLSSADLEKIKRELRSQAEDVYKALKKIESIMEEYKDCFVDDVTSFYRHKYETMSAQYYTIYENMISISDEFTRLNYKYAETDKTIAASIKGASQQ